MSFLLKIGQVALVLLCFFHKCENETTAVEKRENSTILEPVITKSTIDQSVFNECSEITRKVLITHCGSCHQSSLPTQKAGAIAIFDLDKNELWHTDLKEHHTEGIGNRLLNKSSVSEQEKEAIELFLELKAETLSH